MIRVAGLLIVGLLAGCANPPPISSNPFSFAGTPAGNELAQDILAADNNLNQAVTVGALAASDPAPPCMNAVVSLLGLSGPGSALYTPEINGPVSLGSVIYIRTQQVLAFGGQGASAVPVSCEALLGQIVIDAGKVGIQIGAGMLPLPPIPFLKK